MGATASKPRFRTRRCLYFKSKLEVIDGEKESPVHVQRPESKRDSGVAISQTQTALLVTPDRGYQLVHDFPVPQILGPEEVMIRNCATGLNHIDWKSVDYNFCLPELPWITGREMAGVVESVGSEVKTFRKGDRVWTSKSCPPSLDWPDPDKAGTYYKDKGQGAFRSLSSSRNTL